MTPLLALSAALLTWGFFLLGREVGEMRAGRRARRRAEKREDEHKAERAEYYRLAYERGCNKGYAWGWRALRQRIEDQGMHVCDDECLQHAQGEPIAAPAQRPS